MDLSFLTDYYVPIVVVACLVVGYCIKHISWLESISNEYIPTIMALLGAVISCVASGGITLEYIVYGAVSGLASTGLHQVFTQIINRESE